MSARHTGPVLSESAVEPRLSFVTLGVSDLARARAFYEGLGLVAAAASNPQVTFFQLSQGLVLALFGREDLAEDAGMPMQPGSAIALAHNVRSAEEVDALLDRARALGGRITREGSMAPWGIYRGYFADLDGHAWEVAWNPMVRWDEAGGVWLD